MRLARPDASDDEVESALGRIGALERFGSLPAGIHTDVQTRGVRLSSGERQLIALARAALVEPAVIVLDEATSSLDPGTERAVERAIAAVSQGRTVITIAHRLSTAERADRVALFEQGRLVEIASHDVLVAQGARYAALWASWQAGLADEASDHRRAREPNAKTSRAPRGTTAGRAPRRARVVRAPHRQSCILACHMSGTNAGAATASRDPLGRSLRPCGIRR